MECTGIKKLRKHFVSYPSIGYVAVIRGPKLYFSQQEGLLCI
jgi:hypothetical protein